MPPNSHHLEDNTVPASFTNSFWSKDKSGMNQLLGYMKSTHDDLDIIYTIYTQRYSKHYHLNIMNSITKVFVCDIDLN